MKRGGRTSIGVDVSACGIDDFRSRASTCLRLYGSCAGGEDAITRARHLGGDGIRNDATRWFGSTRRSLDSLICIWTRAGDVCRANFGG